MPQANSRLRFLEYFARRCHERRLGHSRMPPREVRLVSIEVCGLPDAQSLDVECFSHVDLEKGGRRNTEKMEEDAAVEAELSVAFDEKSSADRLADRVQALLDESTFDSLKAGLNIKWSWWS